MTIVKMDVEGSEYKILPRIREEILASKCSWYISFHPWVVSKELHDNIVSMFYYYIEPERYFLTWADKPRDRVGYASGKL